MHARLHRPSRLKPTPERRPAEGPADAEAKALLLEDVRANAERLCKILELAREVLVAAEELRSEREAFEAARRDARSAR